MSQINLDRLGAEKVKKACAKDLEALATLLRRFDSIIEDNQQARDAHRSR